MPARTLLVTGASGQLGRAVVAALRARGHEVIAASRNPAEIAMRDVPRRRIDFDDGASLAKGFHGVDRALIISTDAWDRPGGRALQHARAIRAAEAAGVGHVVFTSRVPAGAATTDDLASESALVESELGFTILRFNLFSDLLLAAPRPGGLFVTARGDGQVAYVTRADAARCAAAALASDFEGRRTLEVSGPEALAGDEVANLLGFWTRTDVRHVSAAPEALARALENGGTPPWVARALAGIEIAAAHGELARVTGTVRALTGEAPLSLGEWLASQRPPQPTPRPAPMRESRRAVGR